MVKSLVKNGNSKTLVISREMLGQLNLTDDRIEIVAFQDGYVIRPPRNVADFDTAVKETLAQYEGSFRELAK